MTENSGTPPDGAAEPLLESDLAELPWHVESSDGELELFADDLENILDADGLTLLRMLGMC